MKQSNQGLQFQSFHCYYIVSHTYSGSEIARFISILLLKKPGPEVLKPFSCSNQLSMKFHQLIKSKMLKKFFKLFKFSDVVFIMLINVKMPTIVGILTFMTMIHFTLN